MDSSCTKLELIRDVDLERISGPAVKLKMLRSLKVKISIIDQRGANAQQAQTRVGTYSSKLLAALTVSDPSELL
jgi:hypothetical protein